MGILSSTNQYVKDFVCVVDVFTKYPSVKKGKTILNPFIEIVNEYNRKPYKLWVDQGR